MKKTAEILHPLTLKRRIVTASKPWQNTTVFLKQWWRVIIEFMFILMVAYVANVRYSRTDRDIVVQINTIGDTVQIVAGYDKLQFRKATFYVDGRELHRSYASEIITDPPELSRGIVTFIFDDGWLDVFTEAYPILRKHGLVGTVAVISSYVNQKGSLSARHLRLLVERGWDIASHATDDVALTEMSIQQVEPALRDSQWYLWQNLWGAETLVFPFGATNEYITELSKKYYKSARVYTDGHNTLPVDPYNIVIRSLERDTSYREVQQWIDEAEKEKSWLVLTFHHVSKESVGKYSIKSEMLEYIAGYVNSKNVDVLTYEQSLQHVIPELAGVVNRKASWEFKKDLLEPGKHSVVVEISGKRSTVASFTI